MSQPALSQPVEPTAHVESRPWGRFELLVLNSPVTVKVITVLPGQRLSLQRHSHRDEWWQIIDSSLHVELDGVASHPRPGERVWIPRGTAHRVGNQGAVPGRFLEIALGAFDEQDIVRLEDDYARVPTQRGAGLASVLPGPSTTVGRSSHRVP